MDHSSHYTPDPCTYNDDSLSPVPVECLNYLWRNKGQCTTRFVATDDPNFIQLEGTEERFPIAGKTLGMARKDMENAMQTPLWNPPICNRSGANGIVQQRTKLKELDILVEQYKVAHATFLNHEKAGNIPDALTDKTLLKTLNDSILMKLTELERLNDVIYPHGITNQQQVDKNNPALNAHLTTLYQEHQRINDHIREYNNAFGKNEDKQLVYKSHTWRYIFYLLVAVVVSILVIRAYTTEDQHGIEIVIIVIAAFVGLVHLYNYLVKWFTETVLQ